MKNSLMRKYRPQMILFLIIVIETGIFTGLVQYRNYIQKKQAEDESLAAITTTVETTQQAQEDAPEEITTLENPVRDKNAAKDAYKKDGIRIVCLDPALGGYAKGNESEMEDSKTESQYNLEFAQLIKSELNNHGVVVYMTREDNKSVDDSDRTDLANNAYADLLVSLNRESYDGSSKKSGVTAWIQHDSPDLSKNAAERILSALKKAGATVNAVDAGTNKSTSEDYSINKNCIGPSLVLGMGSVLNESDITDYEENKEEYAKAVADAIVVWMDAQGL